MNERKQTGPRDVFANLLATIGLYVSVISFGTLLFGYIEIYFPDALAGDVARYQHAALRWPISILVIVFPLFVWLTTYLQKDLLKYPEKRELRTRKWLLYFTLFLTTIIIVGDLISLLYWFLSGDVTTRFVLKVFAILLIAAVVFVYYLWNLRKEIPASHNPMMRLFVRGVVALAGVAIVAGFFVVGSPQTERMLRFDDRRVGDLQSLQYEIVNFWQTKEHLPQTLAELTDDIRGFTPPQDPENNSPYEYRVTGDKSFELCAVLSRETNKDSAAVIATKPMPMPIADPYVPDNFLHAAGRQCFTRTIDPDRFPPFNKTRQIK